MVIFRAELKINHDDWNLGAGHNKDDKYEEEEPKEVIELILVDGAEDEEQLNEAGAKR